MPSAARKQVGLVAPRSALAMPPPEAGAGLVIAVPGVEAEKVEFVLKQVMHGMLETARQQLLFQIHRQEPRAGVDRFVTGHRLLLNSTSGWSLVIPYGSRHDGGMNIIFLKRL